MQQYMATTRKPEPKGIRNREPIGAPELTCGLDVSDRYTHVCVLDSAGEVIHEQRIRTTGNDNPFWPHLDPLNWPHPRDVVSWSVHLPSRRW